MSSIVGKEVFIVIRPWDYRSADVIGVFDTKLKAEEYAEAVKGNPITNFIEIISSRINGTAN